MKITFNIFLSFICALLLLSCNKNLTDEEKKELYAKSTARDEIVKRSGSKIQAGTNQKLLDKQMDDARNRLMTGGGLFGKGGLELIDTDKKNEGGVAAIGLPINPYLWRGRL